LTQKSYKKFDLFVDRILKRYHTLVEIKNLRDQLSNGQQQRMMPSGVCPSMQSTTFNRVESSTISGGTNNLSEYSIFDDDYSKIVG
jgi:hypothetical protein